MINIGDYVKLTSRSDHRYLSLNDVVIVIDRKPFYSGRLGEHEVDRNGYEEALCVKFNNEPIWVWTRQLMLVNPRTTLPAGSVRCKCGTITSNDICCECKSK